MIGKRPRGLNEWLVTLPPGARCPACKLTLGWYPGSSVQQLLDQIAVHADACPGEAAE